MEQRNKYFSQITFIKDYKSGYMPIEIQRQQEIELDKMNTQQQKISVKHFIRQKQSQNINLKRTCGVSYVKMPESKQHNVSDIYKPLPQLVFQCSNGQPKQLQYEEYYQCVFEFLFQSNQMLLCTMFESEDENAMRNYLIYPNQRWQISGGKYFIVQNIKDMWPLFVEKHFLCIHFIFDEKYLMKTPQIKHFTIEEVQEIIKFSDMHLGFIFKKSINGKKSFIKTLGSAYIEGENKQTQKNQDNKEEKQENQQQIQENEKQQEIKQKLKNIEKKGKKYEEKQKNNKYSSTLIITNNKQTPNNNINNSSNNETEVDQNTTQDVKKDEKKLICQEIVDYIQKDQTKKNINTLSVKQQNINIQQYFFKKKTKRFELYIDEIQWKKSSQLIKSLLSTFILYAKDEVEKLALEMMNIRIRTQKENDIKLLSNTLNNIRQIYISNPYQNNYIYIPNKKNWYFNENILKEISNLNTQKQYQQQQLIIITLRLNQSKDLQIPTYYISTRDSFAFDLYEVQKVVNFEGRKYTQIDYYFDPKNYPSNFASFLPNFKDYRVGCTLFKDFFTHEEMIDIENETYKTEIKCFQRHYFPMTAQVTCTAEKIRRTKFFFGSRYMWTKMQLAEPHSYVGAGVRQDVSETPLWIKKKVVQKLENANILPKKFINSLALNVYHDGNEGLAQHFDDATRFMQPIFTFKLFSDARLSFGSQFYGFCNSAFVIPMPRGSILKLEENSYAANGIKHCVRPCDMTGKNATIIMRQMHHKVVKEAEIYDENIDLPNWFSTLSAKENSVPYGEQKRIEAEFLQR
ncbi:hypothetical protein IMG5_024190 [Ichthyophthirius multifiliis]|uniref:Uncharacterized protein n=1 Tax=Ichthyophthirius multifiliis TaxID=5932 RepID=G0QL10_ICHMU|nr:hypothetical protein IMG5_024190 [Ichthyophthirius multifiliis]EGR34097.1 hypothetical protein IMG5_024190 [Ichthyophthirius multifiliis]|eukprot:XP_004039401.1 hypothetical protein IMG5_024190 [Ichthyophthirius multifiliis]